MVKLGKSDIFVSAMTVGCWPFGSDEYWGEQSQQDVNNVVSAALEMGVNTFDTAEVYNNCESERSLGIALHGRRNEATVISKISPSNCHNVRQHCINSLQRLDMDYLDVYMLHWPINTLGVKHFTSNVQTIESRAIEADIVPYCMENNISIIGSMGLQQGLLAGIYSTACDVPKHQAHSRHFANFRGAETSRHHEEGAEKEIFEVVNQLREIAHGLNIHVAQLSIAWILKKPFMASTHVGSRNIGELKMNVAACSMELPDEIETLIDEISLPVLQLLGNSPDYYEHRSKSRIF